MKEGYDVKILAALELLRLARNNMLREEFEQAVAEICVDGNLRYPLILAGQVARIVYVEEKERADDDEQRKTPDNKARG